jgi:hypothetical protein
LGNGLDDDFAARATRVDTRSNRRRSARRRDEPVKRRRSPRTGARRLNIFDLIVEKSKKKKKKKKKKKILFCFELKCRFGRFSQPISPWSSWRLCSPGRSASRSASPISPSPRRSTRCSAALRSPASSPPLVLVVVHTAEAVAMLVAAGLRPARRAFKAWPRKQVLVGVGLWRLSSLSGAQAPRSRPRDWSHEKPTSDQLEIFLCFFFFFFFSI